VIRTHFWILVILLTFALAQDTVTEPQKSPQSEPLTDSTPKTEVPTTEPSPPETLVVEDPVAEDPVVEDPVVENTVSATASATANKNGVIALRLAKGSWSDAYNDALWEGMSNALREVQRSDIKVVMYGETSVLSEDTALVLSAGNADSLRQVAEVNRYSATHFVILDGGSENQRVSTSHSQPNLQSVTFDEHEVSYLLGYLAGTLSQTGILGFVGDTKTPETLANQAAFSQGLFAACLDCNLHSAFVESKQNADRAKALAQSLHQKGADIIFAAAGDSSQGVIDFVNETMCASFAPVRPSPLSAALTLVSKPIDYLSSCTSAYPLFFMGIGRYQPALGDTDNDPNSLNHGLASILKRVDLAAYEAVQDFVKGTVQPGTKNLGLKDDAVDIAVDDHNRALLPTEVLKQLETLKAQIISSEIVVDTVPTTNE
jgi:basic membrane protein A and related proteins